jgi:hypothetical protein
MDAGRLHPALVRELARLGRAWGAFNERWLAAPRDYSHGSPAFKWGGADPVGAPSRARRFWSNTAITSPNADRKAKLPEQTERAP